MYRFFDNVIPAYSSDDLSQPPSGLFPFFMSYVKQVRWLLGLLFFTSGILSAIGALIFVYIGILIDRMGDIPDNPGQFFTDNSALLIWIFVLILVIEPIVVVVHQSLFSLSFAPSFTTLVRWQTHRYVLRQSLSFFQNDFAGRIANRIAQTSTDMRRTIAELIESVWYVVVFIISSLAILFDFDWRLGTTLIAWMSVYIVLLRWAVPRVMQASAAMSDANSGFVGRIVDSYTNIQTVKLFGHTAREDDYAREGLEDYRKRPRP